MRILYLSFRAIAMLLISSLMLVGCGYSEARDNARQAQTTEPLASQNYLQPGLVGLSEYAGSGWGPAGYPGVSGSQSETEELDPTYQFLNSISVQASDLGESFVTQLLPKGDSLGVPTLDFCGREYESDLLRLARWQLGVYSTTGQFSGVSSEAVQYESPEAAQSAIDELLQVRTQCFEGSSYSDKAGQEFVIEYFPIAPSTNATLVERRQRVMLHFLSRSVDQTFRSAIILQVRGNTLLGFYVSELGETPFSQETIDTIFSVNTSLTERLLAAPDVEIGILD